MNHQLMSSAHILPGHGSSRSARARVDQPNVLQNLVHCRALKLILNEEQHRASIHHYNRRKILHMNHPLISSAHIAFGHGMSHSPRAHTVNLASRDS